MPVQPLTKSQWCAPEKTIDIFTITSQSVLPHSAFVTIYTLVSNFHAFKKSIKDDIYYLPSS